MQKVVICGGNGRVGTALADSFAAKKWDVYKIDHVIEQPKHIANIYEIPCDLANISSVDKVFNEIGNIDVLINCVRYRNTNEQREHWDEAFKVGLNTYYNSCSVLCEKATKNKHPCSIINISSILSILVSLKQSISYHAVKGAINQMTRHLALKYGSYNIRANSILPGLIGPPMNDQLVLERDRLFKKAIPLKHCGTFEDLFNLVYFLSIPASKFITGQNIILDGGLSIREQCGVIDDCFF